MSALSSPNCPSPSSSSFSHTAPSSPSPSSSLPAHHQRRTVSSIPKRFLPKKLSLQSPRNPDRNVVRMQDGAVAANAPLIANETSLKKLKDGLLSITSSEDAAGFDINKKEFTISIIVVGASGDLAKKKIFPALFALYYEDCLPKILRSGRLLRMLPR